MEDTEKLIEKAAKKIALKREQGATEIDIDNPLYPTANVTPAVGAASEDTKQPSETVTLDYEKSEILGALVSPPAVQVDTKTAVKQIKHPATKLFMGAGLLAAIAGMLIYVAISPDIGLALALVGAISIAFSVFEKF